MRLNFIINGEDVPLDVPAFMRVGTARDLALEDSFNTGREPHEWELRHETGVLLPPELHVEALQDRERIFVTLRVGAGGSSQRLLGALLLSGEWRDVALHSSGDDAQIVGGG